MRKRKQRQLSMFNSQRNSNELYISTSICALVVPIPEECALESAECLPRTSKRSRKRNHVLAEGILVEPAHASLLSDSLCLFCVYGFCCHV